VVALPALAATGQMALTNYLLQSVVLGFIFYGYSFGLFGRTAPVAGALTGIALYAGQLVLSRMWTSLVLTFLNTVTYCSEQQI
jgi:uncharacterized protein